MSGLGLLTQFGLTKPDAAPDPGTGMALIRVILAPGSTPTETSQAGWEFTALADLTAVGARVSSSSAGVTETVRLWRVSDQALLASENAVSANQDWVDVEFAAPVALAQGANYVITMHSGTSRGIRYRGQVNANVGFSRRIAFVAGRYQIGTGFPANAEANAMRGFPDLLIAGEDPPLPSVIERVGSGAVAGFGASIYNQFVPVETVTLAGVRDTLQPSGVTLQLHVWEVGVTGAPIATSAPVTQVSGAHEALLTTPVVLQQGTAYRVGWVKTAGAANPNAVQSASSWANFFPVDRVWYATGAAYPSTDLAPNSVPINLLLALP